MVKQTNGQTERKIPHSVPAVLGCQKLKVDKLIKVPAKNFVLWTLLKVQPRLDFTSGSCDGTPREKKPFILRYCC